MEVLKHTSPQAEARAPKPVPWNTDPSSSARMAFIAKRPGEMLGEEADGFKHGSRFYRVLNHNLLHNLNPWASGKRLRKRLGLRSRAGLADPEGNSLDHFAPEAVLEAFEDFLAL